MKGRIYKVTDRPGRFDVDHGTGWDELYAGSRGKSIIATEEARTNTAFGLLTTPDRVQGIVTDGLLVIDFRAHVQESVANAASVAIFVGATELSGSGSGPGANPTPAAAANLSIVGAPAGTYGKVFSGPTGLAFAVGAVADAPPQVVSAFGRCVIEVAAGTYDVSVQYKASSGTVTAKNRKLWVKAEAF